MKSRLLQVVILFFATAAAGAQAALPPLLSPAELSARLAEPDLRLVDIRPPAEQRVYIAGAAVAPYGKWRGPADDPGRLPDAAALSGLVGSLGIDETKSVVVIYEGEDATDFGAAARVYWTLKSVGIQQVAILNGGMRAWQAAGLPTVARPAAPTAITFTARPDPRWLATREQVAAASAAAGWRLLDARPAAFFRGEKRHAAASLPGTLVGAKNVEHTVWFEPGTATLASPQAIRATAQRLGVDADAPTVSFCNTGHWAATQWFVLSEVLGGRDVRLYPESMVDWSRAGLAMANVPGRLAQFWMQLRAAFGAS